MRNYCSILEPTDPMEASAGTKMQRRARSGDDILDSDVHPTRNVALEGSSGTASPSTMPMGPFSSDAHYLHPHSILPPWPLLLCGSSIKARDEDGPARPFFLLLRIFTQRKCPMLWGCYPGVLHVFCLIRGSMWKAWVAESTGILCAAWDS